jgi:hypothetical protein
MRAAARSRNGIREKAGRPESVPLVSIVERGDGFRDRASGGVNILLPSAAEIIY